jgi:hypothetical protein
MLGGSGTVFVEGGRVGARFATAGLLELAAATISNGISDYKNGSGGMIRNYKAPEYKAIFLD